MRTFRRVVVTVGLLLLGLGAVEAAPAAAGGGGCHRDMAYGPTEGRGETISLEEFCMTPSILRVEPGSVVTFVNHDEVSHNLYGSGMFVHDLVPEARVAFRFDDEGTFPFACTFHPGMVGAIAVGGGQRLVSETTSILPAEVQPVSVVPASTTTLAPVPASSSREPADDRLPIVPLVVALGVVAVVAYGAGRSRRVSAS
jgi:plastocyanin